MKLVPTNVFCSPSYDGLVTAAEGLNSCCIIGETVGEVGGEG